MAWFTGFADLLLERLLGDVRHAALRGLWFGVDGPRYPDNWQGGYTLARGSRSPEGFECAFDGIELPISGSVNCNGIWRIFSTPNAVFAGNAAAYFKAEAR